MTTLIVRTKLLPYQVEPADDWQIWWYVGGRGIGKSWRGSSWIVKQAIRYPDTEWAAIGKTWGETKRIAVNGRSGVKRFVLDNGLEPLLLGGKWSKTSFTGSPGDMKLTFANGSIIHFASADNADSLRGLNLHGAWCDEVCFWPSESWKVLQFAVRETLPDGSPPRTIATSTPDGENWVWETYVRDGAVKGVAWIGGGTGPPDTPPSTYDNPHLDKQFVEMITREYEGTEWGDQELRGLFVTRRGAIFKGINVAQHTRAGACGRRDIDNPTEWDTHPSRPGFVWPTPGTGRTIGGQDLGTVHPSAFLIGAWVKDVLCITGEVVTPAATETEWHGEIRSLLAQWEPTTIHSESASPMTTNAQRTERGMPIQLTRKSAVSVESSIRSIQQLLRDGLLVIDHAACPVLWKQLRNYKWKTDAQGNPVKPEQPVKSDDDAVDALRYLVLGETSGNGPVESSDDSPLDW
ncbi:terminase large subunit domain-containing protein [Gemmatimonas sp.]|uniref:terminase large subunit domain-containing protein n=1 Tax=Gemmatimonas sp. TaxID=1962908 RepID=UPI0035699C8E